MCQLQHTCKDCVMTLRCQSEHKSKESQFFHCSDPMKKISPLFENRCWSTVNIQTNKFHNIGYFFPGPTPELIFEVLGDIVAVQQELALAVWQRNPGRGCSCVAAHETIGGIQLLLLRINTACCCSQNHAATMNVCMLVNASTISVTATVCVCVL